MAAASIIASVITGGTNSHQSVAEDFNAVATDFVAQGVVGTIAIGSGSTAGTGSFAVTQDSSPDMGVTVLSGQAYVLGTPTGQDSQVIRARMTANYTSYTINANASGSTKYDWIYLQLSATNANTPSTAADNVITLYTSRSSSNASDNGSPPTYGILLAVVTVVNGASSITNANIADKRTASTIGSATGASATGWNALSYPLTYGVNNGNKEFTVTTGSDLTGILSPGMKLKVARSVTPPTQCMSFTAASSQYATKASPSGITFTSAFTCEAWVYLNSYTGSNAQIITRTDATAANGFYFMVNSSGQLSINYATGGTTTTFQSYQSIPLKRWVHVAGVISSIASKTLQGIYINGVSVPTSNPGTAAAAITQTGNLSLGCYGAGNGNFFDGYISEARVWSVAQSQANIQANMAINLVGNETNLVALFQGNGNFNDATSNANNLTATNGAIATQANNPYNATEYAVVTKVSYSNPTTTVTLFTGTDYNIPNQTLNSPNYSTSRAPYGFPAGKDRWLVDVLFLSAVSTSGTTINTTYNPGGVNLSIPSGEWHVHAELEVAINSSASAVDMFSTLSTSSSSPTLPTFSARNAENFGSPTATFRYVNTRSGYASLTTATPYYILLRSAGAFSGLSLSGDPASNLFEQSRVTAECAYI